MIRHQFGYSSVILEKMYNGEFVDSEKNILNLSNALAYYNADSIEDIESLLYEYFKVKDFDFNDLLSNKEIDVRNVLKGNDSEAPKCCCSGDVDLVSSKATEDEIRQEVTGVYTPIALPHPLPSVSLEKGPLSGNALERTIKSLLLLEKKHILKCFVRNTGIQRSDVDAVFMIGPFMMALLDYIQFSSELIGELQRKSNEGEDGLMLWEFGDYIKEERYIPIKESLSVFSYFRCVLFELYQEILILFGDVINRDGKRKAFYELYSMCFEHSPLISEVDSYTRAVLLCQSEKVIALCNKADALSLLGKLYAFYNKHKDDEQIQRSILRVENRVYWAQIQCMVEISALEDWDFINDRISKVKGELIKQIECEVNSRNVLRLLDKLNNLLQETGFLHLPGSKSVDIEFSIVRNLECWLQRQYDLYDGRVSEYLPIVGGEQLNMATEVKPGYNICEMKKTVKEMLQYMSGTNREHNIIMTPSDYQYMLDCFYYFVDYGCGPKNMRTVDCQLNIGVISYTFYVLYKLIYPNDSSKRKAWLQFICALFRNLPSPEELYNNFSRKSEEFLKYYFSGDKNKLFDYIRNH